VTPDVVVDVGNSRMKWGRVRAGGSVVTVEYVPLNLGTVWTSRFESWNGTNLRWAVAGSNPERRDAFAAWLSDRGCQVTSLTDWRQFGVRVTIPNPERVGHDRLLGARAAVAAAGGGNAAVVIDAGTAVTVNLIDASGGFAGGAIFPGVGAMARALHQFTAQLPEVTVDAPKPPLPGTATEPAMRAGIWWAVVGGVRAIVAEYRKQVKPLKHVYLTGGDAELLHPGLHDTTEHRPYLTLEGIRIAAEALP
jgi:type III pantothenate kinase